MTSIILDTDSYKLSHYLQYPPGTTEVTSYIEPRGGARPDVVFFGLQSWLKSAVGQGVTREQIDEAEALCAAHVGIFNRAGWDYIVDKHDGRLPVEIQALPEGTVVTHGTPVVQIRNTDPECYWLTSYLETALLRAVWYPSSVASISFACKRILRDYLEQTCDTPDEVLPFQLHDFGARGAASEQAAGIGGLGHLVNFRGTDTISALLVGRRDYNEDLAGFSIPASEHSTMTAWGKARERDAYANMIDQFGKPEGMVAFVTDSWDIWNAVDEIIGQDLKAQIEKQGGRVVVRPDSGEPTEVVPEIIVRLMKRFGYRMNAEGFKVLPDYIRIIQGDGITVESLPKILEAMKQRGLSAENAAFGMGGGLLQKVDRDTFKWAMKACEVVIDGARRDVFKDPVTDPGKRSKKGRQAVAVVQGRPAAVREDELGDRANLMQVVWRDGELLRDDTLEAIRKRADAALMSPTNSRVAA